MLRYSKFLKNSPLLLRKLKLALFMGACFIPVEATEDSIRQNQEIVKVFGIKNFYTMDEKKGTGCNYLCLLPYFSDFYVRKGLKWMRKTKSIHPYVIAYSPGDVLFDQTTMDPYNPAFGKTIG